MRINRIQIRRKLTARLKDRRSQLTLLWILLLLIYLLSPIRLLLNRETLTSFLHTLGPWSALLFINLYAISMVIGLPTVIFTIAGGSAFGLVGGTLYSTLGATLGAAGACWLSRYLLHQWAARRFRRHPTLRKFQQGIGRRSLQFIIAIRLSPVTPFNIENYLFGLTTVRWRPYLFGTVLGILPGTIAYTWVGVTGAEALQGESAFTFFLAVTLLIALSILPVFFTRK